MCGINGFFNFQGSPLNDEEIIMEKMNLCIQHRGPDDHGIWKKNKVCLGHQRLSIIDLSAAGHQPMTDTNGNTIVFNGEIYNYQELKKEVSDKKFISNSDTEVILYYYEKYGEKCMDHFNGMFAFAIWDEKKDQLFLAKDRIGKKPLYYTVQSGVFAFSSEIKALLSLPWIKRELNEEALYHFLTFNFVPAPMTMFKDIFKFEPAHKMLITKNGIKDYSPYWDIDYKNLEGQKESYFENEILNSFRKSVKYRMVSDVPVGAFLSGGVDSSAVVAMMSQMSSIPIKTYSIGFDGQPDYDELKYAENISNLFNTDHYEKIVSRNDMEDFLPAVIDIFDDPLADTTAIPIYFLSQLARKNGTVVVLNGDGADEIFAGYKNYLNYKKYYPFYHQYLKFPLLFKNIIASGYSFLDNHSAFFEILHRAKLEQEFFQGGTKSFKESSKNDFLSASYKKNVSNINSYQIIERFSKDFKLLKEEHSHFGDIDWMCYLGTKFIIPNRYLYRMDKLGMAHSVEARSPFLDYELVNFALSIPEEFKIQKNIPKFILKKAFEKILPKEVLYRRKMGFCVPIREWAEDLMVDFLNTNIKSFCANTGMFNEHQMRKIISNSQYGHASQVNNLWTMYFLMGWMKKWMGV